MPYNQHEPFINFITWNNKKSMGNQNNDEYQQIHNEYNQQTFLLTLWFGLTRNEEKTKEYRSILPKINKLISCCHNCHYLVLFSELSQFWISLVSLLLYVYLSLDRKRKITRCT